jgi:hypothetical protein
MEEDHGVQTPGEGHQDPVPLPEEAVLPKAPDEAFLQTGPFPDS